ncbi:MAG: transposase [Muribaculum sp.]|nr:transposase [Muribaculum sp.]
MADKILWDELEVKYATLFPSDTGNVAKPLRMVLASVIIQNRLRFTDRELVEQITESPYLQYFIGLPGYQDTPPFDASTLVLFRKRITADMLNEANEYLPA